MEYEKNTLFWVILIELKKSTIFFWIYYSIESIRHNSFNVYKFPKAGVHGKYILISSRDKFT